MFQKSKHADLAQQNVLGPVFLQDSGSWLGLTIPCKNKAAILIGIFSACLRCLPHDCCWMWGYKTFLKTVQQVPLDRGFF
jgi:hypothetical protein